MSFYKFCASCGHLFVNEEKYMEHLKDGSIHTGNGDKEKKTIPDPVQDVPANITMDIDSRIANTISLREIKKQLRQAGIDCNTMTSEEAKEAYEKINRAEKVKDE